ncbi:MAG: hypothetical protein J0I77_07585 [Rudaea sp.]|uniref:hypothetical protein n=1 Tax=unclassified Rudaea TaxID=2627037 RepID=UPI0014856777|nr:MULTISPECIES: hypothetical protein [unclassified Rudaea]MBN8885566.1 hypothetical protein [Rudaea sp.]MBR0347447.1 hypothetical protein [Rudaea sp.]
MDRSLPPLITRLRRRLFAVAWFGVVAILFKVGVAMACLSDGSQMDAGAKPNATATVSVAVADSGDDAVGAACWHANSGGCHCGCLHGSALSTPVVALPSLVFSGVALPMTAASPPLSPRESVLRPPIV